MKIHLGRKGIPLWLVVLATIPILLLGGCSLPTEQVPPTKAPTETTTGDSPLLLSPISPPAAEQIHFRIETPLLAGATTISGQGPAGTPIEVVDITVAGEVIGTGTIGDDRRFVVSLVRPLQAGHMIGITLATAREAETWPGLWELRGENARAIPQLGYYFDTGLVE